VVDRGALERRLRNEARRLALLLTRNRSAGREVLRVLLAEPIRFTPVDDEGRRGYRFEGTIALDRIVAGIVDLPLKTRGGGTSPAGFDTLCVLDQEWIVPAA
jgi:hypothetical protein